MGNMEQTNKADFGFQWHITDRCNLRCTHCYQEDYSDSNEPSLDDLRQVADEIIKTLSTWNKKGDIALTGGEPFLKRDIFPLIDYLESFDEIVSIDLLSNGTLIDESTADKIVECSKIRCVQISLDGATPKVNNSIRGEGTYERAISAIRLLKSRSIPVNVMFTLQRQNIKDIPALINLAISEGILGLTIERFVPIGSGSNMCNEMCTPEEIRNAFEYISTRIENLRNDGVQTHISQSRPLWVLCNRAVTQLDINEACTTNNGGICSIGLDGLCILPDSTILACRRLPIPIGNLKRDSLLNIWHTSDLLYQIADKRNLKGKCNSCEYLLQCSGCRAIAYSCTGDYLAEDSQCWK